MTYSLVTGTQANTSIERLLTTFAGTDANRFLNRKDEYLSVAEVSGSCSLTRVSTTSSTASSSKTIVSSTRGLNWGTLSSAD